MTALPLQSRVALVTGGASGIGLGIAAALLARGAAVIIGDIRSDHMDAARAKLSMYGERLWLQRLDVADPADWARARTLVADRYGTLHVLCLNAGIGVLGTIMQASPHDWSWLTGVNLGGVTLGIETFLPMLCANEGCGYLLATASMGGLVVADDGGIYSSAKFGVVALMECLRKELATQGIGVTVLCPAGVNTNIHDHASMRPQEFADSGFTLPLEQQLEVARSLLSRGADPLQVGERAVDRMLANEPYVFTDAAAASILEARRAALLAACTNQA
jgi:NAD(P)-dependent dehydrogenase (short-subunit alcohol dehydrogenase family)